MLIFDWNLCLLMCSCRYIGPLISRRKAADFRKISLKDNTFGTFTPGVGGWDASWDSPRKFFMLRPYKGVKPDRTRETRAQKIEAAMKSMPERIEKLLKEREAKKGERLKARAIKRAGRQGKRLAPDANKAKAKVNDKNTSKKGGKGKKK